MITRDRSNFPLPEAWKRNNYFTRKIIVRQKSGKDAKTDNKAQEMYFF